MLILPPVVRRDILMSMHALEHLPGAFQEEQDWAFQQFRYKIQTRTELLAQYDALPMSKPLNHLAGELAAGGAGEDTPNLDLFPEPAPDDVAGQALYAVYKKGFFKSKCGGKGGAKTGKAQTKGFGGPGEPGK